MKCIRRMPEIYRSAEPRIAFVPEWGDTRLCRLGRFPTPFCGERGALLHLEKLTFVQFYRRKVALPSRNLRNLCIVSP